MGKVVIILVVGLSVIVGIISISMIGRVSDASKSSASTFKKTYAGNISSGAAEYYIRQLKTNPALRGTFSLTPILNGSANVTIADWTYGSTDSIRLTSIGIYSATQETLVVKLQQGSQFPIINSAISFRTPSLTFIRSGTLSIDGHNHDINKSLLPPGVDDRAGAGVTNASDSTTMAGYGSQLNGTKDVQIDGLIPDPQTFAAGLISRADYTLSGSYGGAQVWGSSGSPKIVYCNGNVKFTAQCNGWGILICNSNTFESINKFTFTGLVIQYSTSGTVSWKTTNTMNVIGGLLLSNSTGVTYSSSGTANINYSKAALDLAKTIFGGGGGGITVANWSE